MRGASRVEKGEHGRSNGMCAPMLLLLLCASIPDVYMRSDDVCLIVVASDVEVLSRFLVSCCAPTILVHVLCDFGHKRQELETRLLVYCSTAAVLLLYTVFVASRLSGCFL